MPFDDVQSTTQVVHRLLDCVEKYRNRNNRFTPLLTITSIATAANALLATQHWQFGPEAIAMVTALVSGGTSYYPVVRGRVDTAEQCKGALLSLLVSLQISPPDLNAAKKTIQSILTQYSEVFGNLSYSDL